jgi:hypothetical protein
MSQEQHANNSDPQAINLRAQTAAFLAESALSQARIERIFQDIRSIKLDSHVRSHFIQSEIDKCRKEIADIHREIERIHAENCQIIEDILKNRRKKEES